MDFVVLGLMFLVAGVGLVIGWNLGSKRMQEVLIAAITLAYHEPKKGEKLGFDELVQRLGIMWGSPDGIKSIRILLKAAKAERDRK